MMDGQEFRNVPVYRGGVKVPIKSFPDTLLDSIFFPLQKGLNIFLRRASSTGQELSVMLGFLLLVGFIFFTFSVI